MHVVKTGESLNKIAYGYQLEPIEIQKINKHITNWDKLIPGTKIKLPEISKRVSEELDEVEPFIEDYYPKVEVQTKEEPVLLDNLNVDKKSQENPSPTLEETKIVYKKKKPYSMYNPYYPYYMYNPYTYNSYYNQRYHTPPKKRSR